MQVSKAAGSCLEYYQANSEKVIGYHFVLGRFSFEFDHLKATLYCHILAT
jgi:hypothetical protein